MLAPLSCCSYAIWAMGSSSQRLTVFVSYCRKDLGWLKRLRVHLRPLERRGNLDIWDDSRLNIGEHWREQIADAVEKAAAVILIVSADFLASDFIMLEELPSLLQKARKDGALVLPIVVQPCTLSLHPELRRFQAMNTASHPLSKRSKPDVEQFLRDLAMRLDEALARRHGLKGLEEAAEGKSSTADRLQHEFTNALFGVEILRYLASVAPTDRWPSLTEIQRALGIESRKRGYQALEQMCEAGWVQKVSESGRASYAATNEGARQLRRFDAIHRAPSSPP